MDNEIQSFLDTPVDEAPEQVLVPKGEYLLEIALAESGEYEGGVYLRTALRVQGQEQDVALVNHTLFFPTQVKAGQSEADFKSSQARAARSCKTFCQAFNVSSVPRRELISNCEQLTGRQAFGILDQKEDGEYGRVNYVKKWTRQA